ncbi:hypothetical protein RirG_263080 [Rhizophagus irregularis DAOM 197198w]|uniref:Uncharacterized protein n=1 Tax=Rhizophagus irregularis (strain DAOM 197198w) TaxID=1432141 RepID=A0A015J8X2_RHIIW|nr:hypothetical protein RirG_263080 [Rhizophagus irregularis DAOM 197198w]
MGCLFEKSMLYENGLTITFPFCDHSYLLSLAAPKILDVNDAVEQEALRQLESYLQLNVKSLKDFPDIPLFLEGSGFLDGPDVLNQLI